MSAEGGHFLMRNITGFALSTAVLQSYPHKNFLSTFLAVNIDYYFASDIIFMYHNAQRIRVA